LIFVTLALCEVQPASARVFLWPPKAAPPNRGGEVLLVELQTKTLHTFDAPLSPGSHAWPDRPEPGLPHLRGAIIQRGRHDLGIAPYPKRRRPPCPK